MADMQQMMDDLEELKHLGSIAKRPLVLSLISSEIRNLQSKIEMANAAVVKSEVKVKSEPADALSALKYVPLDKFSWDQDDDKIKIYVFLEGVKEENVETVFKRTSVDIKFHDVQGKNYRCAITKLNKEIVPEKCKVLVKPSKVVITLFKASRGHWLDLHFKEDKLKPSTDSEKDPMAGIMDLMKVPKSQFPNRNRLCLRASPASPAADSNQASPRQPQPSVSPPASRYQNMYEEGDDEMKKTIAKAWTDARSGKTADPLQRFGS